MKRAILILAVLFGLSAAASAQSRSIGFRTPLQASYEHSLGADKTFAEVDLGLFYGGFTMAGLYNWILTDEMSWIPGGTCDVYAGPGVVLGVSEKAFNIGACAQVGFEYFFDAAPVQLSLDIRPCFQYIGGDHPGFWTRGLLFGIIPSLGVRYVF